MTLLIRDLVAIASVLIGLYFVVRDIFNTRRARRREKDGRG